MTQQPFQGRRHYRPVIITKAGFNIIESMIALALLASITLSIALFKASDMRKKNAKILSSQTEAFAIAYAKYMKQNYEQIGHGTTNEPYVLSPEVLANSSAWPFGLATTNMYRQIPCVIIVRNKNTNNLEAIMYYVGGKVDMRNTHIDIMKDASIELGDKGGILEGGEIRGNAGWSIATDSSFLNSADKCGANIANNSIAVNMDLLSNWNQNLQQINSLLRGIDKTSGLLSLPGHVKNSNTLKTNLYLGSGSGVVLQRAKENGWDQESLLRLAIANNGSGSGAATLGLNNAASILAGDTFQPDLFFRSGESCKSEEEGKIVADKGINNEVNKFLSRSILVCTQNDMLCGIGSYCYLPPLPNKIVFQNTITGIQDRNNEFVCPKSVPFAISIQTGLLGGNKIFVIANTNGTVSLNIINATLSNSSSSRFTQEINCPASGCSPRLLTYYGSLQSLRNGLGQIEGIDLATIKGNAVGLTNTGGNPRYKPINGVIGNFVTPIGFSLSDVCPAVCSTLTNQLGNTWQVLGTNRINQQGNGVDIVNGQLGCACERTDLDRFQDGYMGIAAVIGSMHPYIISVTCSNMPLYYMNN